MPFYDGHSLQTPSTRLASAKLQAKPAGNENIPSGVRVTDAFVGEGVRVANRHVIITNLLKSLKFEAKISCFDVNLLAQLLFLAVGRVVYVVNLETSILKANMGKSGGSSHKEDIRACTMDIPGKYGATCGEDKRVIIWDLTAYKASKIIEGHHGALHSVEFSPDSERLYTSSDDGRVNIWDWRSGNMVVSAMRHPSAVRCFDFNYSRPDLVVCGCNDGHITVWNTNESIKVDDIIPENELIAQDKTFESSAGKDEHHAGAILSIRLSLDKTLMATCSTDSTCKIWKVGSYLKDINEVKKSLQETEDLNNKINGCIDVLDESYNEQLVFNDRQTLKIGELPIYSGYHADLRFTLIHVAPVLSCSFTKNSDMLVTGSLDSTVRIWSSRRGEPLFQINVPDPVPQIKLDFNDTLYCSCSNRILIFSIKPMFKEAELPNFWKNKEMKKKISQGGDGCEKVKSDESSIPLSELRKLIAHGVVLPDTIEQIGSGIPDVDMNQLISNMKKFNIFPQQILRLIAQSKFLPKDILKVLSSKNPQTVMALLAQGASITTFMLQRGFKMLSGEDDPFVTINWKNLARPDQLIAKRHKNDFNYENWWKEHFDDEAEILTDSEEDDFFWINDKPRDYQAQKGRIVHFIPSEHMKILKDLSSNREVKSIFLRSIASQKAQEDHEMFPNFRLDEIQDNRPILKKSQNPPAEPLRFNEEFVPKAKAQKKGLSTRLRNFARPDLLQGIASPSLLQNMALHGNLLEKNDNPPNPRKLRVKPKWTRMDNQPPQQDLDSSTQVLKPKKFLQTRGLDIQFGITSDFGATPSGGDSRPDSYGEVIDKMIDTIFTQPLVFSGNSKERYSVPVSSRQAFKNNIEPVAATSRNGKGKDTASTNGGPDIEADK